MAKSKTDGYGNYIGSDEDLDNAIGSLPHIAGTWFFVDPTSGSASNDGLTPGSAFSTLKEAYDVCTSGAGDGIVLYSRGTGTSSQTTSYLQAALTWSKHGITVVGVCAPVRSGKRARIANHKITTTAALTVASDALNVMTRADGSFIADGWKVGMTALTAGDQATASVVTDVSALSLTVTDNLGASAGGISSITSIVAALITISGSNNAFKDVAFYNGGSSATEIGGLIVSGDRNYFGNCEIVGGVGAATSANNNSLTLTGSECTFEKCTIGTNTFAQGNNAASEIVLSGTIKRNKFIDCEIVAHVSAGTAHGAVKSVSTSGGTGTVFKNCLFNYALSGTTPAAAHITSGAVDEIICMDCAAAQVSSWGASVYSNMATSAASAGGGLMTTE